MPTIDKPLNELLEYQGRNPKPADFDAFWDRSLAEMHALDPQITITPAKFQAPYAKCSDMYFTGVDGSRVYAQLLQPIEKPKTPKPAVLMFHGYSGNCGDWNGKLAYVAMGYTVAALDARGQGGKSEDRGGVVGNTLHGQIIRGLDGKPEDLLFRKIFLDTAQLAGIVMKLDGVDPKRVYATGGSQGGALTLACASLEPRVAKIVPVFPFLCDYKRTWEMDLAKDAYQELKDYFRLFDPRHEREDEVFTRLGYIDLQFLAPRIRAETILVVGLMDTICPPSTQFAAYNKITAKKSLKIYPDFGHEGLPDVGDITFGFFCE